MYRIPRDELEGRLVLAA